MGGGGQVGRGKRGTVILKESCLLWGVGEMDSCQSCVSLLLCAVRAKPGEAQGAGWFLRECEYASLANVRPNASPVQLSSK